jgi:carbon-monoxide dehydrogenase iron sulfur subunit
MEMVLTIQPQLCTGCRSCEMACSLKHDQACSPLLSRIRVLKWGEVSVNVPLMCQQCEEPPCEKACPTGARVRDAKTGAMVTSENNCIGCRSCIHACPFGAPIVHPSGKSITCDLCEGDPECVQACTPDALTWGTADSGTMLIKRQYSSVLVEGLKPPEVPMQSEQAAQ